MRLFNTLFIVLVVLPIGFMLAFEHGLLDSVVDEDWIPADPFIKAELRDKTSPEELAARVEMALDKGLIDDAEIYAEIADYTGAGLPPLTRRRLDAETSPAARFARGTGNFFEGFLTGEGSDSASFAGAIASDLTVVGDVRDIGREGSKMVAGEDYSQLILGLSVVGVAATGATLASGGGALPVKVGVSLMKVAKKAGTLTVKFSEELVRLLREAVQFQKLDTTLRQVSLADSSATRRAVVDYADSVSFEKLRPVLEDMNGLQRNAGPAEAVRLLGTVDSTADLSRLRRMSEHLGPKTRGVVEITGKTSLRAFKTLANLIRWVLGWIWAILSGAAAIAIGAGARRILRRRKAAA